MKMELRGTGVAALRECLLDLRRAGRWPLLEPLPVTRFLGESFGISNVSAYRVLSEFSKAGHLWRAANGRYFLADARRLLEKPAPVACLIRRLERWSEVGREIMQGVDDACGELERAMLLVHDRILFRQADPMSPTTIGSVRDLRATMEDFLLMHSARIEGVVLDELWPDRVLSGFKNRLRQGVILYRRTKLPFLGCVSADTDAAAQLVVQYAMQNSYKELAILLPGRGYAPALEMAESVRVAAAEPFPEVRAVCVDSEASLSALVDAMRVRRQRTLLVATEDNLAVATLDALGKAGVKFPRQAGLLSTMGSRIATRRAITCTEFDFRLMGVEAARMAVSGNLKHLSIPPVFTLGDTA